MWLQQFGMVKPGRAQLLLTVTPTLCKSGTRVVATKAALTISHTQPSHSMLAQAQPQHATSRSKATYQHQTARQCSAAGRLWLYPTCRLRVHTYSSTGSPRQQEITRSKERGTYSVLEILAQNNTGRMCRSIAWRHQLCQRRSSSDSIRGPCHMVGRRQRPGRYASAPSPNFVVLLS